MKQGEIIVARLRGGPTVGRCLAPPAPSSKGRSLSVRVSMGPEPGGAAPGGPGRSGHRGRRRQGRGGGGAPPARRGALRRDRPGGGLGGRPGGRLGPDPVRSGRVVLGVRRESGPAGWPSACTWKGSSPTSRTGGRPTAPAARRRSRRSWRGRRRREENRASSADLVEALSRGELPAEIDGHQGTLLEHLRGYAVHGDSYTRGAVAQGVLTQVRSDTRELQRLAFELLVETGLLSADHPLELEQAGIPREFPAAVQEAAGEVSAEAAARDDSRADLTGLGVLHHRRRGDDGQGRRAVAGGAGTRRLGPRRCTASASTSPTPGPWRRPAATWTGRPTAAWRPSTCRSSRSRCCRRRCPAAREACRPAGTGRPSACWRGSRRRERCWATRW